jgi:hypothetical protein
VELLRHRGASFRCPVYDNWNEESSIVGHIAGAVRRQTPLTAKVALIAAFRISRNDRDEQAAVVDVFSYPAVPSVSAPQFALVEPDLDASRPKGIADPTRGIGVLRSVAKKHRPGRRGDLA